ncbi:MAG: AAA family ATPase [Pseudomonadota bacterium]
MRLDKLTIGSAKDSKTHQFKNLKNVSIDFDQDHWVTVVIGWNGTGKSNALEALAIIFRDLIGKDQKPAFAYRLAYRMGAGEALRHIHIDADPDRAKDSYMIHVATDDEARGKNSVLPIPGGEPTVSALRGNKIKFNSLVADDSTYLPRYVFSYYSGESPRMHEIFKPYLEKFDSKLRKGVDPGLKRLFYAMPVHSQFVLLAFMIQQPAFVSKFLEDHFDIDPNEGLESVLFVLRQPPWKISAPDSDPRFWNARGVVSKFLARVQDVALAPITVRRTVPTSLWNEKTLEFKYLFVRDIAGLRHLVGSQEPAKFFRDLESTYVSQLIDEVRIRVRLKKNDGSVTFRELSEGEQQLLTVLGLLRFTAEEESLFLLDEPDTHLNPRWSVDYIHYLKQFISNGAKQEETSHILLTTHNPLAIAELEREQVQILRIQKAGEQRQIVSCFPEMAPRGMGYAAIVTSDMFGIASSLDGSTQLLLEKQRALGSKNDLSDSEQEALDKVNEELSRLGFRFFHPDDEFSRYLRLRNEVLRAKLEVTDPLELAEKTVTMSRQDREDLATDLIAKLIASEDQEMGESSP